MAVSVPMKAVYMKKGVVVLVVVLECIVVALLLVQRMLHMELVYMARIMVFVAADDIQPLGFYYYQ